MTATNLYKGDVSSLRGRLLGLMNEILEDIYRVIYVQNSNMTTALRVAELEVPVSDEKEVVLEFIRNSTKGIMRGLS